MTLTDSCRCGAKFVTDGHYSEVHKAHTRWLAHHTDCPFPPAAPEHTDLGGREVDADDTGARRYPLGFAPTPAMYELEDDE